MTFLWYEFDQNNSGGSFDTDYGYKVFIQAGSSEEANDKAEGIGLYFNGCDDGRDCYCCGDRWHPTYKSDGFKDLNKRIKEASIWAWNGWKNNKMFQIVYADGRQEWRGKSE